MKKRSCGRVKMLMNEGGSCAESASLARGICVLCECVGVSE